MVWGALCGCSGPFSLRSLHTPHHPSLPLTAPTAPRPPTAGPADFIGDLSNTTLIPPLELDGATLRLATSNEVFGLGLAGMSALHVSGEGIGQNVCGGTGTAAGRCPAAGGSGGAVLWGDT